MSSSTKTSSTHGTDMLRAQLPWARRFTCSPATAPTSPATATASSSAAQVNGVSFGRYVTSDGIEHFVDPESRNTLGTANAGPKVGPGRHQ